MDWFTLILLMLVTFLTLYNLFLGKRCRLEKLGILHVKGLPLLGNMAAALFRQRSFADVVNEVYRMNDAARYVGFYDFGEPVIMLRSPELIKNIMVKHFDHFTDHRGFADPNVDPFFGTNLFALRGEKWKEIRTLLSPAFTSSKMKSMFKLMLNCSDSFVGFLTEKMTNKPIDAKDAFTRYTNDVIATCIFGISVDSMRNPDNEFYVTGRRATNLDGILGIKFFMLRSFPRLAKIFGLTLFGRKIEDFFIGVIRDTVETRDREGITRNDLVQLMMETRGGKTSDELSIFDMTTHAFVFFFGGFDTTSTLMCFATHEIAINPKIQRRLQDEIDAVLEETNGEVTYEAINGMEYLDAVINEALRVYPILVFLDRCCVKRYVLPSALPNGKSVTVEPGQNFWFPVHSIHHDERFYSKPDEYDPERFLGDRKRNIDPFAFFPFGQGPRMCIGFRFALLETKVMIFHLLAKCHLKPSDKMCLPLEISKTSFAMTAKGGFWLQLESRDNTNGKL